MNSNKLLSICIPTYNRAEVLDETLNTLFTNPDFEEKKIEVIVSDNASNDNTSEIVAKYPLVKYYRNDENVRDCNFSIALGYATGSYIRLFNDTLSFKKGTLKIMLDMIEKHLQDDCNLFFYGDMFLNSDCVKEFFGKLKFLKTVSYYSTWIANFGVWKNDFKKLKDKDRYSELQFVQVDWSYRIVENGKKTLVYFVDFFHVTEPKIKGGYNIIKTFVNNYLEIVNDQKVSLFRYEIEKYFLCRYFIFPWLTTILIRDKSKYDFETDDAFLIILKKYWYEPYFYSLLLVFGLRKFKYKIYYKV